MSKISKVAWTDASWNVTSGCTPISEGCVRCYAAKMAKRLQAAGVPRYADGFKVTLHPDRLEEPQHWRKRRRVFVVSMGDLFHEDVPFDYIRDVFGAMAAAPQHDYLILTKRAARMRDFLNSTEIGLALPSLTIGVTAENQARFDQRVGDIEDIGYRTMVSCEPLLGPIEMGKYQHTISWLIVGGESDHHPRPMDPQWARNLLEECRCHGIPFFFKQHSGPYAGWKPTLDDVTYHEFPDFDH